MAYTPTEWQCNDVITAEKLNHLEQGIVEASESGGGGLEFIGVTQTTEGSCDVYTLNKTASEIRDIIIEQGKNIVISGDGIYSFPIEVIMSQPQIKSTNMLRSGVTIVMSITTIVSFDNSFANCELYTYDAETWSSYPRFRRCESA